jgi:uncharacterized membrane protein
MIPQTTEQLRRWREAGLLTEAQAAAILRFEASQGGGAPARLHWPAILALAFGALMVGAGTLLFVAAHWESMSPTARILAVLAQLALFHGAGAFFSERMPRLATALHGLGTLALGAGIFLAGQIFHLQEHWPAGLMLWALGAVLGFGLLRDWVQGALLALLAPAWLMGEWTEAAQRGWRMADGAERVLAVGCFMLALTYLTARRSSEDGLLRKALAWIGALALIPCVLGIIGTTHDHGFWNRVALPGHLAAFGWTVALLGPLALAFAFRGKAAWMNAAGLLWAVLLGVMSDREWQIYAWCAFGAVGIVFWGLHESRRERVNLGVAGFAITLVAFYFSSVMDRLGRSLGLMGLGLLFLLGGWQLERLRRRLNARIQGGVR